MSKVEKQKEKQKRLSQALKDNLKRRKLQSTPEPKRDMNHRREIQDEKE